MDSAGGVLVCLGLRISRQSRGLVRSGDRDGAREVFELVRANRAVHQVATMCRVLARILHEAGGL